MKKMQQTKFQGYRRIFFIIYFIKHNSKGRSIKKINWVGENVKKIMEKEREKAQIEKRKSRKIEGKK